jgi:transcriptional regulator with GAF, ATPase, and Fis domain
MRLRELSSGGGSVPELSARRRKRVGGEPGIVVEPLPDRERQYTDVCALLEVARSLFGTRRAPEILGRLLHSFLGVAGAAHCVGFIRRGAERRLEYSVAFGLSPPAKSRTLAVSDDLSRYLTRVPSAGAVPVRDGPPAGSPLDTPRVARWLRDVKGEVLLPIVVGDELAALAVVGPRLGGEPYGDEDLALLARAAALAAHAIDASMPPSEAEREFATSSDLEDAGPTAASRRIRALRQKYPVLRMILGESPALLNILDQAVSVAPTRCPVLIEGETGCGKELLARAVHEMSPRARGPFEVIDCGSIPKELIESELFGHERGAFTGAVRDRKGLFELAHGGTLFLDELGELPLSCQTRLLRVLQEGCFRRVGGETTVRVDVRVIAATNRNLWDMVEAGRFRRDLFYRVSVLALQTPPLRERKQDIPILARHFAEQASREMGTPDFQIDRVLEQRLREHDFPGNIRELQNLITALAVGSNGPRASDDLDYQLGRMLRVSPMSGRRTGAMPPRRGETSMGGWVLEHLRRHAFNVAAAERTLETAQEKRGTLEAPVADRSTLTYYLQGECLREFCAAGFDFDRAVRSIAGEPQFVEPVGRRFRSVLRAIAAAVTRNEDLPAARREAEHRLGKLPACYREFVDRVVESYHERRWSVA